MANEVLLKEDASTFTVQDETGRVMQLSKAGMNSAQQAEIKALARTAPMANDFFPGVKAYGGAEVAPERGGASGSWTPEAAPKRSALPLPAREQPQQAGAEAFFQGGARGGNSVSGPADAFGLNIAPSKEARAYKAEAAKPEAFLDTEEEVMGPVNEIFREAARSNADLDKELAQTMAPDYAVQAGEVVGAQQALAYQQRAINERMKSIQTTMNDMSLGLQYPGASLPEVKQWKNVLDSAGADDPRSLGPSYYRQYVTAAENLRKAQEVPSVEPKGFKRAVNAIAMALGAFGASLTKTPNFAQQYIESVLDREVARQKDEYERKKTGLTQQNNLYAQAVGEFKDSIAASQVARAMLKDNMAMQLEKAGYVQQGQKLRAEGMNDRMAVSKELAEQGEARKLAGVSVGAQLAASGAGGPAPVKEGLAKEFSDNVNSVRVWNVLEDAFKKNDPATFVDSMLAKVPYGLTKEARYEAIRKWALAQLAPARMGRLTDRDLEMLDTFIVSAGKNPAGAKELFRTFRQGALSDVYRSIERSRLEHGDTGAMERMADKLLKRGWRQEAESGFQTEDFGEQADTGAQ